MRKLTMMGIMVAFVCTAAACMTEDEEIETSEVTAELTICRFVDHFAYSYGGSGYRWDVTTELGTGRQFVDEWRQGNYGGTHVQYRVSPLWSWCAQSSIQEVVQLRSGVPLIGTHNCLPGGRQEFHGSDYQRVLELTAPFHSINCDP